MLMNHMTTARVARTGRRPVRLRVDRRPPQGDCVLAGSASDLGLRVIRGDRENVDDLRRLARQGPWDVVVDVAGSAPAMVSAAAKILADVADRLVFMSTYAICPASCSTRLRLGRAAS